MRVLDGAIAIIDGSAGVEAQTLTVWRQSNKYKLPRIAYINKMDKIGSNLDMCLDSIEKKLNTVPLQLQYPVGREKSFNGVIDLVNMKRLVWNQTTDGKIFQSIDLNTNDADFQSAFRKRIDLIEKIARLNEDFAEILLEKYNLEFEKMNDNIMLESYIRKSCLSSLATPVLCGSSFRNIGIQPVMDAIIKYLPSPFDMEQNNYKPFYDDSLFMVSFKIIHDHQKSRKRINRSNSKIQLQTNAANTLNKFKPDEAQDDILTFVRVYNGELHAKSKIYNPAKDVKETCDKIYIPYSNELEEVQKIGAGNIALVHGLTNTTTGDILVHNKQIYDKACHRMQLEDKKEMQMSLDIANPVYFCTVEPESESDEKRLNYALECLQREDPSLRVLINEEENLGQTIIQGQGELHLDIVKDRILREYKLKAFFGPLNIAYKEMPTKSVTQEINYEKILGERRHYVKIELNLFPRNDFKFKFANFLIQNENVSEVPIEKINSLNHGISSALNKGVILRYPFINTDVNVIKFETSHGIPMPYISSAAYQCTIKALENAECVVIQPIMNIDVLTSSEYSSKVYSDLTRRNAINIQINQMNKSVNINAKVPLAKLRTYSTDVRKLTSGNSTFSIEFDSYDKISQRELQDLIEKKF